MARITPYINFADKGHEMIDFYKGIFGGEAEISLVKDSAMASQVPPEWGERIMHLDYKAGDIHLMGSDLISDGPGRVVGNGYSLALTCDSDEQLHEWHSKLSEGAKSVMPASEAPWGGGTYGEVTDKYSIRWMLSYERPSA